MSCSQQWRVRLSKTDLGQCFASHNPGSDFGQWHIGRLADKGHGPAGPRIDLQDVDHIVFDGELDIDQSLGLAFGDQAVVVVEIKTHDFQLRTVFGFGLRLGQADLRQFRIGVGCPRDVIGALL